MRRAVGDVRGSASHGATLARPDDEGSALRTFEEENAASGEAGRRDATGTGGSVHYRSRTAAGPISTVPIRTKPAASARAAASGATAANRPPEVWGS